MRKVSVASSLSNDQIQQKPYQPGSSSRQTDTESPLTMTLIRKEFELPQDEDLFDDFKCTLKQTSGSVMGQISQGRLYITDRYLCFSCNVLGLTNKVKIKISDVKSIQKSKMMGFFNSGIIIRKLNQETQKEEKFQFGQFKNRELTFERIMALWRGRAPQEVWQCNQSVFSGTEAEQIFSDAASMPQFKSDINDEGETEDQSVKKKEIVARRNSGSNVAKHEAPTVNGMKKVNNQVLIDGEFQTPRKMELQAEALASGDKSPKKEEQNNKEEEKIAPPPEKEVPVATDEQLINLAKGNSYNVKTYNLKQGWKAEGEPVITDLTLDQFYEEFIADDAVFGNAKLAEKEGNSNITVIPWKKNQMIVKSVVAVVGVPFVNSTRVTQTIKMVEKSGNQIVIEADTKAHDAPYADTFSCKEVWIVLSNEPFEPRSILIRKQKIAFVKYTMFKSKIEAAAIKGMLQTNKVWLQHVTENGNLKKKAGNHRSPSPDKRKSFKEKKRVKIESASQNEQKVEIPLAKPDSAAVAPSSSSFDYQFKSIIIFLLMIMCSYLYLILQEQKALNAKFETLINLKMKQGL